MSKAMLSSIAMMVPRPVRRGLKTLVLPPVLRAVRRAQGKTPKVPLLREYRVSGHETFAGYYEIQPMPADGKSVLAHASVAARSTLPDQDSARVAAWT